MLRLSFSLTKLMLWVAKEKMGRINQTESNFYDNLELKLNYWFKWMEQLAAKTTRINL